MLRFDVGEDLLHYYCNVDRVTVYATAPVNVAVGARILRQIGAGARDGGQEPRAGSIELAEASYRAAIGETVATFSDRTTLYQELMERRSAAVVEIGWRCCHIAQAWHAQDLGFGRGERMKNAMPLE